VTQELPPAEDQQEHATASPAGADGDQPVSAEDWELLAMTSVELSRAPLRTALHALADRLVPSHVLALVVLGLGPAGWPIPIVERYGGRDAAERDLVMRWAGRIVRRGLHASTPIRLADDEASVQSVAMPLRHAGAPVGLLAMVAGEPDRHAALAPWFVHDLSTIVAERVALEVGTSASSSVAAEATFVPAWPDERTPSRPDQRDGKHHATETPPARGLADVPDVRPEHDQFLAAMSHELRTPLNAILGLTESLLEGVYGVLSTEQATALHDVASSGRLLLTLINDVLDLSKIRAGMLSVDLGPLDLAQVARAVGSLLGPEARRADVTLALEGDATLPAVHSDGRLLLQITLNLLANALKFTPAGGRVTLRWGRDLDGAGALLSVEDTGPGISAEDQERIFTPFVQLSSGLGRQHGGSGLGLALVRRMAPLIDARISLRSQLGEGSTFGVHLPLAPEDLPGERHA
jgi:signal transduction histidine kinase